MPEINGVRVPFIPAGGADELQRRSKPGQIAPETSFEEVFQKELQKLNFSGHAQSRMISRDINLSDAEMQKLESAVDRAEQKGAKESLILFENKAFIVSIPNTTVIPAVHREHLNSNVIIDIPSAVIA